MLAIHIASHRVFFMLMMALILATQAMNAAAAAPTTLPAAPQTLPAFDVHAYGAVGDGKANDAPAIQRAIDACAASGGGVVRIGPGVYAACGLWLRSHVTLLLEAGATLQGPAHAEDYPAHVEKKDLPWSGRFEGVVNAEHAMDVAIAGAGRIDGAGADSWKREHEAMAAAKAAGTPPRAGSGVTQRPRMVQFSRCDHVHVSGITLSNSHQFHLVFTACENVVAEGLTITAPADSPETDGIDLRGARHVLITRCHIDNGDDEVAVKGGYKAADRNTFACDDIEISHCAFLHGHGMSIGSDTAGNVRNVYCHDCTFEGTANGIRIKSMRDRGGTVEHVRYENLTMTDVNGAIVINAYYRKPPKADSAQPVTALTPAFRDVRISNVTASCPKSAGMIVGLPESLVSDVLVEDVHITCSTGLDVRNADHVVLRHVTIEAREGPPLLQQDAKVEIAR